MNFINVKYLLTTHSLEKMPKDEKKEIVIIGKSNVGKSTFINTLVNQNNLAHVSKKPGKTKAISFFDVDNKFRLVDIPGYGYAKTSKQQQVIFSQMIDSYLIKRKNIAKVVVLIDIRRSIQENDKQIIEFLKHYNIPFVIIGTKKDVSKQGEIFKFENDLLNLYKAKPIIFSSKKKYNLNYIIDYFLSTIEEEK